MTNLSSSENININAYISQCYKGAYSYKNTILIFTFCDNKAIFLTSKKLKKTFFRNLTNLMLVKNKLYKHRFHFAERLPICVLFPVKTAL